MIDRRSFARQIVAVAPVFAVLTREADAGQAPPQAAPGGPPTGRGPMDGSPEGDPLPGQKWRVHDRTRPQPRKVTPGQPVPTPAAPSDAIVLFDGRDLSRWVGGGRGGAVTEPRWKVENGYMEMTPGGGGLTTRDNFGDIQLHLEWTTPPVTDPTRVGQFRGNSGIIFMGRYELQILSSYDNPTYADGSAGSIYGLYPPMVNPCLPEGQWNSFDLVFEAPRFEGDKLAKPASLTLFFNGLVVHNRAQLLGATARLPIAAYTPHEPELPLSLQAHVGPARYRNIWVRRLPGYDA
jgi:hypothetical protein